MLSCESVSLCLATNVIFRMHANEASAEEEKKMQISSHAAQQTICTVMNISQVENFKIDSHISWER